MPTPTVDRILVVLKATLSTPISDGSIVSSRFLVALIATGTSTLRVVGILVALKATVDKNVDSHCWQDFGSFEKLRRQLRSLTGSIVSSRFLVALIATGTSTLKLAGFLVALKATVTEEERWRTNQKGKS